MKAGRSRTLPYRTPTRADCASCAGHAESQFLGWLRRMNAAQPGFPTMIRSVFVRVYGPGCPACHAQLVRVLGRYRLADRLRYVAQSNAPFGDLMPTKACSCNRELALSNEFEVLNDPKKLNSNQRDSYRDKARTEAKQTGFTLPKTYQVDHNIPLAQAHFDKDVLQNPNQNNLRILTAKAHQDKEKMWNDYVYRTFYKRCTSAEERKKKLEYIFRKLSETHGKEAISQVFGKELELLELELY